MMLSDTLTDTCLRLSRSINTYINMYVRYVFPSAPADSRLVFFIPEK